MSAVIVGWGHTPFGRHEVLSLEDLIAQAAREAIADAGIAAEDIDAVWLGHFGAGKRPKRYLFVPDLPKNAYGKVLKTELRDMIVDHLRKEDQ